METDIGLARTAMQVKYQRQERDFRFKPAQVSRLTPLTRFSTCKSKPAPAVRPGYSRSEISREFCKPAKCKGLQSIPAICSSKFRHPAGPRHSGLRHKSGPGQAGLSLFLRVIKLSTLKSQWPTRARTLL
jgi:hypothetical protein